VLDGAAGLAPTDPGWAALADDLARPRDPR
jgi:hypothetical protein